MEGFPANPTEEDKKWWSYSHSKGRPLIYLPPSDPVKKETVREELLIGEWFRKNASRELKNFQLPCSCERVGTKRINKHEHVDCMKKCLKDAAKEILGKK